MESFASFQARFPYSARRALLLACVVGLLASGFASATENRASSEGRRYALLVGTSHYEQWPNLVNPVPDMRALAEVLRGRYGFLTEQMENPSRADILNKLRAYVGLDFGPRDQLMIVFAGHGAYDEMTGLGFLAARDSASESRDPTFDSLLGYPTLLTLVDKIQSRQILLVVDACFSGSLASFQSAVGARDPSLVRRFLTSGGTEYTPDGDPDHHSPFMTALLDALERPGRDGQLELEEIESALSSVDPAPRAGRFGRDGGGDFRLTVDRSGRATTATAATAATAAPAAPAVPSPQPPAQPRLRSEPALVSERDLERAFRRHGLFEATWSFESDFPNEFRQQVSADWEVVLDLASGLMWQQAGSAYRLTPAEAREYVAGLNRERHAGHADWRLPTLEELGSLLESFQQANGLFLDSAFDSEQDTCWSSDVDRQSRDGYFVSFPSGRVVLAYGGRKAFVRAVRAQ